MTKLPNFLNRDKEKLKEAFEDFKNVATLSATGSAYQVNLNTDSLLKYFQVANRYVFTFTFWLGILMRLVIVGTFMSYIYDKMMADAGRNMLLKLSGHLMLLLLVLIEFGLALLAFCSAIAKKYMGPIAYWITVAATFLVGCSFNLRLINKFLMAIKDVDVRDFYFDGLHFANVFAFVLIEGSALVMLAILKQKEDKEKATQPTQRTYTESQSTQPTQPTQQEPTQPTQPEIYTELEVRELVEEGDPVISEAAIVIMGIKKPRVRYGEDEYTEGICESRYKEYLKRAIEGSGNQIENMKTARLFFTLKEKLKGTTFFPDKSFDTGEGVFISKTPKSKRGGSRPVENTELQLQ